MTTLSVGYIVLYTTQMNVVIEFYQALGLTFVEKKWGISNNTVVYYSCAVGETTLQVFPSNDVKVLDYQSSKATVLCFYVKSLTKVLAALRALNLEQELIQEQTNRGDYSIVFDPDGRMLRLEEWSNWPA